jgi:hypothetical protein
MPRRSRQTASLFSTWLDLAARSTEMYCASTEVIAKRTRQLATMGPNPPAADQREMKRMVEEKADAASESLNAMGTSTAAAYQSAMLRGMDQMVRNATAVMLGGNPMRMKLGMDFTEVATTYAKVAKAGMAPYHRRATSNAKRLRKRP